MERQEIRRVQRLGSFRKVLLQLEKAVRLVSTERIAGDEHSLMQNGLIQRYEFFSLALLRRGHHADGDCVGRAAADPNQHRN